MRFNGAGRIDRQGRVERGAVGTLHFEILIWTFNFASGAHGRKVSLAKRSSERLTLGTLNFAILIWTFQF